MLKTARVVGDPLTDLSSAFKRLRDQIQGPHYLSDVDGNANWPDRGIYFFFSPESELEAGSVGEFRLSRIGTVGVSAGSSNTLWNRLRQHRGNTRGEYAGGGNHRGSIFRLHVGRAYIEANGLHDQYPDWGTPLRDIDRPTEAVRNEEHPLEQRVSDYIRDLPFLWVDIDDEPGPDSARADIESNLIAMTSHYRRKSDPTDLDWLGYNSPKPEVSRSGLWNINHVFELFDPTALDRFEEYIDETDPLD